MINNLSRIIFVDVDDILDKIDQKLEHNYKRINTNITRVESYSKARKHISNSSFEVLVLFVQNAENPLHIDFLHFVRKSDLNCEASIILYYDDLDENNSIKDLYEPIGVECRIVTSHFSIGDCLEAIQQAVYTKCYKIKSIPYDDCDVKLLTQIAEVYVYFLKDQEYSMEYERVSEMVCTIHRLSQQVLESFKMVDLINKLKIGTTKNSRLSSKEYKILMSIGYLNVILSNTSKEDYQNDRSLIFQIILNEAESFATINILPDKSKSAINSCLVGYSLINSNK